MKKRSKKTIVKYPHELGARRKRKRSAQLLRQRQSGEEIVKSPLPRMYAPSFGEMEL